jgi:methyl-accepting chemotaxis protein
MLRLKLNFQMKIILMLLIALVFMIGSVTSVTYYILYNSVITRYFSQGSYLVESTARTVDKVKFEELSATLSDELIYFDDLREFLFTVKESNEVENFFSATISSSGNSLVYVVDGNERYDEKFVQPGTELTVENGRLQPEALEAFNKGRETRTKPYSTEDGKRLLSMYYPIFDSKNKVLGVIACDFNFNEIMNNVRSVLLAITVTILFVGVATVLMILLFFRISLIAAVNKIKNYLQLFAQGDLTTSFDQKIINRPDEIGLIVNALEHTRTSFREIVQAVLAETKILNLATEETIEEIEHLHKEANEIAETTQQISANMEETAASSEEMDATANQIQSLIESIATKAENGASVALEIKSRADVLSEKAMDSQQSGKTVTDEVNLKLEKAINQSKSVNHINTLADSILNITEQTNLLALNAAIEAARAGEKGKGFTVVADEIMKLATESQETATQIIDVTKEVLTSVSNLSDSAQQVLDYITNFVVKDYEIMVETGKQYSIDANTIEKMTRDFEETAEQLLLSVQQTIKAIDEISKSSQESSQETAQIASSTTVLNEQADHVELLSSNVKKTLKHLTERLRVFKV